MVGVDVERGPRRGPPGRRPRRAGRAPQAAAPAAPRRPAAAGGAGAAPPLPDLRDPRFAHRARDAQAGRSSTRWRSAGPPRDIGANDFTHPTYRAVWELVEAAGGPARGAGDAGWAARLRDAADRPGRRRRRSARSAVEPLPTAKEPDASYVAQHVFRLLELTALRRIAEVKSRLQRTNPVEQADRVQPDVRRAGRPRAAPPHAARAAPWAPSEAA